MKNNQMMDMDNMVSDWDENEPMDIMDKKRISLALENQQKKELERKWFNKRS
jgi:hypothetical protein